MVNAPNTSYQPAVAYQGGQVNTTQQEPKTGRTQPKQAPAADTHRGDQQNDNSSSKESRGKSVDVKA